MRLILLTILLQFSGCVFLPRWLTFEPAPSLRGPSISVAEDPRPIVHPAVHPISIDQTQLGVPHTDPSELTTDNFLIHHAHDGTINALVVSGDGLTAYSGGQRGAVVMSRLEKRMRAGSKEGRDRFAGRYIRSETLLIGDKPILALALSSDETRLAVAQFSSVVVFDLKRRAITNVLTRVKGRILSLAWDPRGELVVMGRANGDVYAWNIAEGPDAGEDSSDALEQYLASNLPIIHLAFHPSGRTFFAAERDGTINMWQLLRTEKELGLVDERALIDRKRRGRTRHVVIAGARVEDLWLDPEAKVLFAAGANGFVYRWKVRGLRPLAPLFVGTDAIFNVQGLSVPHPGHTYESFQLLATSGRGQRLRFWCQNPREALLERAGSGPGVMVIPLEQPVSPDAPSADEAPRETVSGDGLDDGLFEALEQGNRSETESAESLDADEGLAADAGPPEPGFVGQSKIFPNPLTLVGTGRRAPLLWAAEKTGSLLTFDADSLLKPRRWLERASRCEPL